MPRRFIPTLLIVSLSGLLILLFISVVPSTPSKATGPLDDFVIASEVRANDPTMGNRDGAGIDGVDMIILDAEGDEVYRKRETDAGYCAFGGGAPNCGVYNFARNGYRWPDRNGERGEPIRRGEQYTLRAEVDAEDGRSTTYDTVIVIR